MDLIDGLLLALTPALIVCTTAGLAVGLIMSMLRILSPAAIVALALPVTFAMAVNGAIGLLAGIVIGAQYGRAVVPVLIGGRHLVPAVVTATCVGFLVALLAVAICLPALAKTALTFGPAEYGAAIILLLIGAVALAPGSLVASFGLVLAGLVLGLVGLDLATGEPRMTFGIVDLMDGIDMMTVAIGAFVIGDVVQAMARGDTTPAALAPQGNAGSVGAVITKGSMVGVLLGLLPGSGAGLTTPASETLCEADPLDSADHAVAEGAVRAAAAGGARIAASQLPLLALGLPTSTIAVLLFGGLILHGVLPGPELGIKHAVVFSSLVASFGMAALMVPVLILVARGPLTRLLAVPARRFGPMLLIVALLGVYSVSNRLAEVGFALCFGAAGYVLSRAGCDRGLLLLGLVMGRLLEEKVRQALLISRGDLWVMVNRPITASLLVATALIVLGAWWWRSQGRQHSA